MGCSSPRCLLAREETLKKKRASTYQFRCYQTGATAVDHLGTELAYSWGLSCLQDVFVFYYFCSFYY
jgi:hypothetical protein